MKRAEGFTILELLVVLFLVGVLARIGTSGLATMLQAYQLNLSIQQFQSDIAMLRSQALASGCTQALEVTLEGAKYSGRSSATCFSGNYNHEDLNSFTHSLPSTIRLVLENSLLFNSRGFVVDPSGTPSEVGVRFLCRGEPCGAKVISILGVLR